MKLLTSVLTSQALILMRGRSLFYLRPSIRWITPLEFYLWKNCDDDDDDVDIEMLTAQMEIWKVLLKDGDF